MYILEVTFFLNNKRHRHGIEIDSKGICSEWFMIEEELLKDSTSKIITKEEVLSFLKDADFCIAGISVIENKNDEDELLRQFIEFMMKKGESIERNKMDTYMHHFKYDKQYNIVNEEKFPIRTARQLWEQKAQRG